MGRAGWKEEGRHPPSCSVRPRECGGRVQVGRLLPYSLRVNYKLRKHKDTMTPFL